VLAFTLLPAMRRLRVRIRVGWLNEKSESSCLEGDSLLWKKGPERECEAAQDRCQRDAAGKVARSRSPKNGKKSRCNRTLPEGMEKRPPKRLAQWRPYKSVDQGAHFSPFS
jgi:hypothetical protein